MKINKNKISLLFLLGVILSFASCKEEYYQIDDKFYEGMQIVVKNPLKGDTLRIEQFNSDKIMIEEVTNPEMIFDSKAFIYEVEHDSILKIDADGNLKPMSRGVSKVNITFRANNALHTAIFVEVYKDYHAVEYLQAASSVGGLMIEKNYSLNLQPYIFVFPAHSDNKKLHFSLDAVSQSFASITDAGIVTGKAPGTINVHVYSEDNPNAVLDLQLTVVNEIEITDLILNPKLNNVTMGVGEYINLTKTITVAPANVNVVNRGLTYEIESGDNVVSIDPATGLLKTIDGGTAVVKATSKNGITKEFTINVDASKTDLTRTFWTVNTSIVYGTGLNYVADGATGKPEDMFDDNGATFLSMVKPGKTYSGATAPAGIFNYFVVDLQVPSKFNAIRWNHRSGNTNTYLRAWGINVEGSNDGETWTSVAKEIALPNTKGAPNANDINRHEIHLGGMFEYRYVKVIVVQWSDNSGGATSGSTMQIGEFGLIKK